MTKPYDVAILGAGPVGVEAAARSAADGYRTLLVGTVGEACRQWGHVRMFTPWRMNTSARGRAVVPGLSPEECPTGAELVSRYLEPLAASLGPLVTHRSGWVESVVRVGWPKRVGVGSEARGRAPFEIIGLDPITPTTGRSLPLNGTADRVTARVVLDCTGTFATEDCDGSPGHAMASEQDRRHLRSGLKDWPRWFADHAPSDERSPTAVRVLILGGGASAATDALALADLGCEVTIATRGPQPAPVVEDDPLPNRAALFGAVREWVAAGSIAFVPGVTAADAVAITGDGREATLRDMQDGRRLRTAVTLRDVATGTPSPRPGFADAFDLVIDDTGFAPDTGLFRELQVHLCYATEGPMTLAASLMGGAADCLSQTGSDASLLATTEPGFLILGAKSYGRRSNFLLRAGLEQVDSVFDTLVPQHLERCRVATSQ